MCLFKQWIESLLLTFYFPLFVCCHFLEHTSGSGHQKIRFLTDTDEDLNCKHSGEKNIYPSRLSHLGNVISHFTALKTFARRWGISQWDDVIQLRIYEEKVCLRNAYTCMLVHMCVSHFFWISVNCAFHLCSSDSFKAKQKLRVWAPRARVRSRGDRGRRMKKKKKREKKMG